MAYETQPPEPANYLDTLRSHSSELQLEVVSQQARMYEAALLTLMHRTGDNTDLVNSINGFVSTLADRAMFGKSDEPLEHNQQADLVTFFDDATTRLGGGQHTGWNIDSHS